MKIELRQPLPAQTEPQVLEWCDFTVLPSDTPAPTDTDTR